MTTPRTKADIGLAMVILFLITLATGIILHLKSHGIILQPRAVIKVIHWVAGFLMVFLCVWHAIDFNKMLKAMRKKFLWFWLDTWTVGIFTLLAFATGLLKLVSPVKIMHLGLWHYWFGILMSVAILFHLIKGIPGWNRLRKIKQSKK